MILMAFFGSGWVGGFDSVAPIKIDLGMNSEIRSLSYSIVELSLTPVPTAFARARAGQFGYLRLLSLRCGWEGPSCLWREAWA
jgi:hypothetical protein